MTGQGNLYRYPYGYTTTTLYQSDLEVELHLYLHPDDANDGAVDPGRHFRRITSILWPEKNPAHFVWHPWAETMLKNAIEHHYLGIIGCASSGKTDFGAVWAIINWLAAPTETLVLVTSTSLKDSRKRIWGSITSYFQKSAMQLPGKLVDSMGIIRTERGTGYYNDKDGIAMIAGEKKKEKEAIGKMIGMKNRRVIMIADELPELSPAILEAAYTNLSSNPFFQLIGIGNFASMFDPLGEFVAPKLGYSSISQSDTEWETKRGYCIRFDGLKSPNLIESEDKWPIYNTQMLARHRKSLGENTIGFWRMVRSFPCPEGASDSIYSEPDFVQGDCMSRVQWLEPPVPVAGLDPAFKNGGDDCVLYLGYYGTDTKLNKVIQFETYELLREDITKNNQPSNFQIAEKFMQMCKNHGVKPEHAALDATGAGAVFYDVVCQIWSNKVLPVKFGGKASERPVSSSDWRPAEEHYANRVSELWFAGLEFIRSGQLKGVSFDLASQMKARKYTTVKGVSMRVQVEPKRDMKERVGWSPDIADAAFVLIELCRERLNAIAGTNNSGYARIQSDWDEQVKTSNKVYEDLDYSEQPVEAF